MRPIKLELEGFTSFRQPCVLLFADLDLFAIIGPTGAGKSSLLDAITYALFGETPRLGKAGVARELVSLGASNMSVRLEFQAGNEVYQVFRGVRGNNTKGQLEKKAPDGSWVPETSAIKELNARIEQIVGLNFDGFTRAVILPQGKFDEFLRGDSKQRREVLKDLLRLQVFERMMQQANSKAQQLNMRVNTIESMIDKTVSKEVCERYEQVISELEEKENEQKQLLSRLTQGELIAEELAQHRTKQESQQSELEEAERESRNLNQQLATFQTLVDETQQIIQTIEFSISELKYEPGEHLRVVQLIPQARRLMDLKRQLQIMENKYQTSELQLEGEKVKLEQSNEKCERETQRCSEDEARLKDAQKRLESSMSRYGLPQGVRALAIDLKNIAKEEAQSVQIQADIERLRQEFSRKEEIIREVEENLKVAEEAKTSAEQRLEELKLRNRAMELRNELHVGEPCPVCEQVVTTTPKAASVSDLEQAKKAHKEAQRGYENARDQARSAPDRFAALEKEIIHKTEKMNTLMGLVSTVQDKVRGMLDPHTDVPAPTQLEQLAQSIEKAQEEVKSLEKITKASQAAEAQSRLEAVKAKQERESIRQRITDLGQQIQELEKEREELDQDLLDVPELVMLEGKLKELEAAKSKTEAFEKKMEEARSSLGKNEAEMAKLSGRLHNETQRIVRTNAALNQAGELIQGAQARLRDAVAPLIVGLGQELIEIKREINDANHLVRKLALEKREQELRLQSAKEKLEKNEELKQQLSELKQSAAVYREMGTLLSANHFQDYMLQSSYRLLAREGSRYFEDLTGGRYSFHSEDDEFSVRDHSNGDELRSVSTLSGGESFLASLSLALALAQSIFELSGDKGAVALESLFLDEGFSTLDAETLGKVADALPTLQKKGRLIGIITHVESLAEQLPSRIEIEKTPTGSRIVRPSHDPEAAAARA